MGRPPCLRLVLPFDPHLSPTGQSVHEGKWKLMELIRFIYCNPVLWPCCWESTYRNCPPGTNATILQQKLSKTFLCKEFLWLRLITDVVMSTVRSFVSGQKLLWWWWWWWWSDRHLSLLINNSSRRYRRCIQCTAGDHLPIPYCCWKNRSPGQFSRRSFQVSALST